MELTIESKALVSSIREYIQDTKKDGVWVLHRAARNVAYKAIEFTAGATAEHIRNDLVNGTDRSGGHTILFRLVNAQRKRQGLPSLGGGDSVSNLEQYKQHNSLRKRRKKKGDSGSQSTRDFNNGTSTYSMSGEAQRFLAKRIASRNYLKSGWFKVLTDLGEPVRNRHAMQHAQASLADKSFAKLATINDLVTILENAAFGAGQAKDSIDGLKKAMDFVAADMKNFALKKLAETADKHSGK